MGAHEWRIEPENGTIIRIFFVCEVFIDFYFLFSDNSWTASGNKNHSKGTKLCMEL